VAEFDLINQYFKPPCSARNDVLLGIGDDCALLSVPPDKALAVSTDTLISGVHFPHGTMPEDIGYKALAVNLSDLAAMGAEPAWASLAISLPTADKRWVEQFMQGFNPLAAQYNLVLVGGDTTQGVLSITVNIYGFVNEKKALKRSNASAGDLIFITGTLGDAGAGLDAVLNAERYNIPVDDTLRHCINRLNRPEPRIRAGLLLTQLSQIAAIDISDGLLVDLKHICEASQTGAIIHLDKIPLSDTLAGHYQKRPGGQQPDWQAITCAGDDYELCFSCPEYQVDEMNKVFEAQDISLTQIGKMTSSNKIECFDKAGIRQNLPLTGYTHFTHEKQ